tara:strand:+ start:235 stop:582 length:348 start_codon:yes stop_codon:yes gene_type:complete
MELFCCKIRDYAYFCKMKRLILSAFFCISLLSCAQDQPLDNMEGWWTMSEGQHYFEDEGNVAVRFVGEDLWGMDEYYSELVPEMGLPVQVIITAKMNGEVLEIHTLEIAPEGCDD